MNPADELLARYVEVVQSCLAAQVRAYNRGVRVVHVPPGSWYPGVKVAETRWQMGMDPYEPMTSRTIPLHLYEYNVYAIISGDDLRNSSLRGGPNVSIHTMPPASVPTKLGHVARLYRERTGRSSRKVPIRTLRASARNHAKDRDEFLVTIRFRCDPCAYDRDLGTVYTMGHNWGLLFMENK